MEVREEENKNSHGEPKGEKPSKRAIGFTKLNGGPGTLQTLAEPTFPSLEGRAD